MTDQEQPAAGVALKPCPNPWCGTNTVPLLAKGAAGWRLACGCGVRTNAHQTPDDARAQWNTRAPTDAGGAVSEAVRRLRLVTDGNQVEAVYRKEGFIYPETTFRGDLRAILAALTPAPQAEGELWTEDKERERRETDYERGFRHGKEAAPQPLQQGGEVTREQVERIVARGLAIAEENADTDPTAAKYLTDAILALFASPDLGDLAGLVERLKRVRHVREEYVNNSGTADLPCDADDDGARPIAVNPDGPEAARAIRYLAADRDKAVGLLREVAEMRPATCETSLAHNMADLADAFLSSQTGGR